MLKQFIIFGCLVAAYVANPTSRQDASQPNLNSTSGRHSFVLLGATGDLSRREIFPKLWYLYRDNQLPKELRIFGYAGSQTTPAAIRQTIIPYVTVESNEQQRYDQFWSLVSYTNSTGNEDADYDTLIKSVDTFEAGNGGNRLFYLALPPAVFQNASSQIKRVGMAKKGWTRVVIEKPFGRDTETANELSQHLAKLFTEDQIYRMDHFLNYEMIHNIFTLRFANRLLTSTWNKDNIASIEVDLRENLGVEGRGGYFDNASIIRDVMQNHLLQIMSLIAMEQPKSSQPNDVRDAKVQLLKVTKEISIDDVVIGQYVANPNSKDARERIGYRDDPTVPKNSISSTFALMVLKVNNKRWQGVPFILRAAKGVNINKTEIIIQFKDVNSTGLFNSQPKRNELHLVAKDIGGLQANLTSKVPGYLENIEEIALDFTYEEAHKGVRIPEAYEKSIRDVFQGSQLHFVRNDEVVEAWRIFTPFLHEIEGKKIKPIEYKFGTTGPAEAEKMEKKHNFLRQ